MSQVKTKEAFQSPDMLQNCLGFLRQYASEKGARAACAVVPLSDIAYPQVCCLCLVSSSHLCLWLKVACSRAGTYLRRGSSSKDPCLGKFLIWQGVNLECLSMQVWKRRGWPLGNVEGALVQLEAAGERRLWLMPADAQDASHAVALSEDFLILEPLFR